MTSTSATALEIPPVVAAMEDSADFITRLRWVVDHLDTDPDGVLNDEMPHVSCRELLRWARKDPAKFFPYFARYDAANKEQEAQEKKFLDDKRTHFTLFDKLLDYWDEHPEADATQLAFPQPSQVLAAEQALAQRQPQVAPQESSASSPAVA